jgi:hypothetical protein
MVIEAGVSESMPRLRADAAWWFVNSNGAVKVVLPIKVDVQRKMITMKNTIGPAARRLDRTPKARGDPENLQQLPSINKSTQQIYKLTKGMPHLVLSH